MKAEEPSAEWLANECIRQSEEGNYERALFLRCGEALRRLAALEQAAEPVKCQPSDFCMAQHVKLYTHPAPRKPMTRGDMRKLLKEHFDNGELTGADLFREIEALNLMIAEHKEAP